MIFDTTFDANPCYNHQGKKKTKGEKKMLQKKYFGGNRLFYLLMNSSCFLDSTLVAFTSFFPWNRIIDYFANIGSTCSKNVLRMCGVASVSVSNSVASAPAAGDAGNVSNDDVYFSRPFFCWMFLQLSPADEWLTKTKTKNCVYRIAINKILTSTLAVFVQR